MEDFLLRTFQRQVLLQCRFMLLAAAEINPAIQSFIKERSLQERSFLQVFYSLQNFLNAGANISKTLWGGGGKLAEQRKPLRDSIGVTDASPLRNVTMRNNFEHLDERIDRWWKESKKHWHLDLNIGELPPESEEIDRFRNYNPYTTDLSFWGQDFNVKALVDEVTRLIPKLEEE